MVSVPCARICDIGIVGRRKTNLGGIQREAVQGRHDNR